MAIPLLLALSVLVIPALALGQCGPGQPGNLCEQGAAGLSKPVPPSGPAQKVASSLQEAATAVRTRALAGATPDELQAVSTELVKVNTAGEVQVYVILTELSPQHVALLTAAGLRVELTLPDFRLVQGWLPVAALDSVAAFDFVVEIRPPGYVIRNTGAVNTAGDGIHRAPGARAEFGVTGAGVKVGVMSDGVDHLASSQSSGDLPAGVQVLQNPGGDEGTAMLEIVHDLAPGAPLAFFGAATSADMVNGINQLAANGARVIVDDLLALDESKFQDGMIAQAARNFATGGRLYVTSAGNFAQRHYRAPYRRVSSGDPNYPFFHNYGGGDIGNSFVLPSGCTVIVVLQWNNPAGASSDDFDLFLVRSSDGMALTGGTGPQNGTQNAYEALVFTNSGPAMTVFVTVAEFDLSTSPNALVLDYFVHSDCGLALVYVTAADSVIGHAAVNEVLSVAALNAATPAQAAAYSSRGPGSISFPTPQTRAVPNVSGIDCIETRVGRMGFFPNPFCGTSAAAPHVAAIAALAIERHPTLTSQQLRDVLTGAALDLGAAGFDFTFGFGRADALNATVTFVDVLAGYWAWQWIEALFRAGVTGGCTPALPRRYCPDSPVTRDQMAVFLLRAKEPGLTPPPCTPPGPFNDVPCSSPFAPWIRELVSRGITAGCGGGMYCPASPVTREQMAVFLLKTLGAATLQPCTGRFADVPCSSPFVSWIEELAQRGITGGCSATTYCPGNPVTRAQMAVFLVSAFDLPL